MRPTRTFVAVLTGITLVSATVFLWILSADGELASASDLLVQSGFLSFIGGFAVVGAVLTVHRPRNAVGWLMSGLASSLALRSACEVVAVRMHDGGSLDAARWVALGVNALDPVWLTLLVGLAVVFPHGRLPGPWWRRGMRIVIVLACIAVVLAPFASYEGESVTIPAVVESGLGGDGLFLLTIPAWLLIFSAMGRIIRLLFRGTDVERRQIGGVAFVLAVVLLLLGATTLVQGAADVAGIVAGLGIPTAVAIGVTRYRLYEIDRIVSRTLTFAIVVGVLGLVYAMVAVLPFALVVGRGASGETPSWVVAGATLAAAALFRPLHRRVRGAVERRFDRSRYDAEQVAMEFSTVVGDMTDAQEIGSGLAATAGGALGPSRVSVWLAHGGGWTAPEAQRENDAAAE